MLNEALASSGPQLVAISVTAPWAGIWFLAGVVVFISGAILLNYKNPKLFSALVSSAVAVWLATYRGALSLVASIVAFKANRKRKGEEDAKRQI